MELLEIIKGRRSVREYKSKAIPQELLDKILDAARWAPSAGNLQPWEIIVVQDNETKKKIAVAAAFELFITRAPVVIVMAANWLRTASVYGDRGANLYCIQDTAAAIQNMLLLAHEQGLGTCWVGAFDEDAVRTIVKLPDHVRPVAIISIGYPDEEPMAPSRRDLSEIVHKEYYRSR